MKKSKASKGGVTGARRKEEAEQPSCSETKTFLKQSQKKQISRKSQQQELEERKNKKNQAVQTPKRLKAS